MPGTPHQLSDDGGQEGLGWCGLRGVTLNLESFHFSALQGGARPDRGSHGPRRSALRAGPAESGLATAPPVSPGDPAGETVPAAASRRSDSGAGSRKVPGREEPPRNSESGPRPLPGPRRSPSGLCARVHAVILFAATRLGVHGAFPAALRSPAPA